MSQNIQLCSVPGSRQTGKNKLRKKAKERWKKQLPIPRHIIFPSINLSFSFSSVYRESGAGWPCCTATSSGLHISGLSLRMVAWVRILQYLYLSCYSCSAHKESCCNDDENHSNSATQNKEQQSVAFILRTNQLGDGTTFWVFHVTTDVREHVINNHPVLWVHMLVHKLFHYFLERLALSFACAPQKLNAQILQHVHPFRNSGSLVVEESIAEIPEVSCTRGYPTNRRYQWKILAPAQLMRTECSADWSKSLASCIHRCVTVSGKHVESTFCGLTLLPVCTDSVRVDNHVICRKAVVSDEHVVAFSGVNGFNPAPAMDAIGSSDTTDDVPIGQLGDNNGALCEFLDLHLTRHTRATFAIFIFTNFTFIFGMNAPWEKDPGD